MSIFTWPLSPIFVETKPDSYARAMARPAHTRNSTLITNGYEKLGIKWSVAIALMGYTAYALVSTTNHAPKSVPRDAL